MQKSAAAALVKAVGRAAVGHDDAAAAVARPSFEDAFSPAPPRAIAAAPLTGISCERAPSSSEPAGSCWVCCEGGDTFHPLIPMGCACRGSAGLAHLRCLVEAALHNVESWTTCHVCRQEFTGEADVGLGRARWERVRGRPAEDEERLFVANNLAVTLKESAGDNDGALRLMQEVLAVRRRLGDEHATLDSLINLALQHHEMTAYAAALPLGEEAVATARRTLGDEYVDTSVAVASLGAIHSSMGDFALARPLLEQALEARRRTLGEAHLETMNSTFLLGQCLVGLGERCEGLRLYEAAAAASRRVLGEAHPSTEHFAQGLRRASATVAVEAPAATAMEEKEAVEVEAVEVVVQQAAAVAEVAEVAVGMMAADDDDADAADDDDTDDDTDDDDDDDEDDELVPCVPAQAGAEAAACAVLVRAPVPALELQSAGEGGGARGARQSARSLGDGAGSGGQSAAARREQAKLEDGKKGRAGAQPVFSPVRLCSTAVRLPHVQLRRVSQQRQQSPRSPRSTDI